MPLALLALQALQALQALVFALEGCKPPLRHDEIKMARSLQRRLYARCQRIRRPRACLSVGDGTPRTVDRGINHVRRARALERHRTGAWSRHARRC